jgi:hypothetical protein
MRCALHLAQPIGERPAVTVSSTTNATCAIAAMRNRPFVPPGRRSRGHGHEAAGKEADREAGDDAWEVNPDLLNVEQPSGLPTDENEADLSRIGKSTSSGAETQTPDHSVSTAHAPKKKSPTTDSTRMATWERPVPDNPRDPRGDRAFRRARSRRK